MGVDVVQCLCGGGLCVGRVGGSGGATCDTVMGRVWLYSNTANSTRYVF